jgi:2-dehydro-3-deoxyphosphogluconate aldolase/(4S)-4-hydroxy-2-oxoglutarate aldolase
LGVVPIVELPRTDAAVPLAEALVAGGLPCVEITLRTESALEGVIAIRRQVPEMLIGAGTVLDEDQVELACAAGADFCVAPGKNERVVAAAREHGVPIIPGISTPSELDAARSLGLRVLKFFPAEPLGGARYLRALCGPFRDVSFVPTGGITPATLRGYLSIPQVLACGGSWLVRPERLTGDGFDAVRDLAAQAVALVAAARGAQTSA